MTSKEFEEFLELSSNVKVIDLSKGEPVLLNPFEITYDLRDHPTFGQNASEAISGSTERGK